MAVPPPSPPAASSATSVPPLSLGSKAAFGIGSASESIFYIAFNLFCFFYFVQVLGLPGNLAGIAAAVALLFDAFSDPLVGYLSDRWKPGKLGRRHPFMFAAAVPLGLSWMALFAPPAGLETWGLFFWLMVFTVLSRISQTLFYVPHIAMGGELAGDYTGRSRVFSWHIIFLWVGGASVHFFGLRYFFASEVNPDGTLSNGMMVAENYPFYGVVWACVMMAVILISTFFTMSRIPYLNKDRSAEGSAQAVAATTAGAPKPTTLGHYMNEMWLEVKEVGGNRNYLFVVMGLFAQALGAGVHETIITHVITYVWQFTTEQFSLIAFTSMVGFAIGFVLAVPLHRTAGKRLVLTVATLIMGAAHALPVGMLWLGAPLPIGSTPIFVLVFGSSALFYSGQSLMLATLVSIIGDIADEHDLNTGRRREGVLYSSRTLFSKVSSAMGHLIAGVMLTVIAFPLGKDILPGTIGQDILDRLTGAYLLLVPLPYAVAAALYWRYNISRQRHEHILEQLALRNSGRDTGQSTGRDTGRDTGAGEAIADAAV